MYTPKPIDTSDVFLPEELVALTEKIAENVHDVWSAGRMAEGWIYGEKKMPKRRPRRCSSLIANCRKAKKPTTETRPLRL